MDDHRKADGPQETVCRRAQSRAQGNLRHGYAPERRDDIHRAGSISTCGSDGCTRKTALRRTPLLVRRVAATSRKMTRSHLVGADGVVDYTETCLVSDHPVCAFGAATPPHEDWNLPHSNSAPDFLTSSENKRSLRLSFS